DSNYCELIFFYISVAKHYSKATIILSMEFIRIWKFYLLKITTETSLLTQRIHNKTTSTIFEILKILYKFSKNQKTQIKFSAIFIFVISDKVRKVKPNRLLAKN